MRAMRLSRGRKQRTTRPAHVVAAADEPERPERELMSRVSDGLRIVLLWHPREDAVAVSVEDFETGREIRFSVDGSRALDAFHHPFAYAPAR
jgi:hypothetical protein